jgi:hypothetical protein
LLSTKEYADFILRFDFMVDPGSHGGIALRAVEGEEVPGEGGKMYFEHPMIKLSDSAKFPKFPLGTTHWLKDDRFDGKPAEVPPLPTSSWHSAEITIRGDTCVVVMGGKPVVDIKLDPAAQAHSRFVPALKRARGKIGFQANTGTVRFRKVEIKELSAK